MTLYDGFPLSWERLISGLRIVVPPEPFPRKREGCTQKGTREFSSMHRPQHRLPAA